MDAKHVKVPKAYEGRELTIDPVGSLAQYRSDPCSGLGTKTEGDQCLNRSPVRWI